VEKKKQSRQLGTAFPYIPGAKNALIYIEVFFGVEIYAISFGC
jgi:hypothetical protein